MRRTVPALSEKLRASKFAKLIAMAVVKRSFNTKRANQSSKVPMSHHFSAADDQRIPQENIPGHSGESINYTPNQQQNLNFMFTPTLLHMTVNVLIIKPKLIHIKRC